MLGVGLLQLYKVSTSTGRIIGIALVSGVSLGLIAMTNTFSIIASAPNRDATKAAPLLPFFTNVGQMVGLAVSCAIFQNRLKDKLLQYPEFASNATSYSKDAASFVLFLQEMPPSTDKKRLLTAYTDSWGTVWLVICMLAAATLVCTVVFLRDYPLSTVIEDEPGVVRDAGGAGIAG